MKTDVYRQAHWPWKSLCTLAALLALLLITSAPLRAQEDLRAQSEGIVAHCFDGDTFKLRDRRVVRLAGIDAPEMGHGDNRQQYYARQSMNELERLAQGQPVFLLPAGFKANDRYGRLVADVRLADGRSLNELMVASGAAFFYPHADLKPDFQERLRSLQAQAIHERRGLWEYLLELPLAQETYVGNRASLRFFPVNCREAQHIKPRNRVHFGTLMDAFLAGYAPARACLFWPDAR